VQALIADPGVRFDYYLLDPFMPGSTRSINRRIQHEKRGQILKEMEEGQNEIAEMAEAVQ
jgi:hypothetical protein